jgi:hypothetical protein
MHVLLAAVSCSTPSRSKGVVMIVEIEPLANDVIVKCPHPRCDGRSAKWSFPQTRHLPTGPMLSCSVHLARVAEIVLNYHAVPVAINAGRRRRTSGTSANALERPRAGA